MSDEITLIFVGPVPSKKNSYSPVIRGGKMGFFKNSKLDAALKLLDQQIPDGYRGLELEHPEIEWDFQVPTAAADRDNKMTTLLDILVAAGVLKNDNIKRCNGKWTVNEAQVIPGQEETTVVTIRPKAHSKGQGGCAMEKPYVDLDPKAKDILDEINEAAKQMNKPIVDHLERRKEVFEAMWGRRPTQTKPPSGEPC